MGMLLRRRERQPEVEPKVNGKPVPKTPKSKIVPPQTQGENKQRTSYPN